MVQSDNDIRINIIKNLFDTDGYIKGYGAKLYRVMDGNHNPLYNVKRVIVDTLIDNGDVIQVGLIFKLKISKL